MILHIALQLLAILIFSLALFEVADEALPGVVGNLKRNDTSDSVINGLQKIISSSPPSPSPKHDSVVLVLIDAWRASFLFDDIRNDDVNDGSNAQNSQMPFLSSFLPSSISAKASICIAKSPTVTLPRIKAINSGVAPHFADIISNIIGSPSSSSSSQKISSSGWIDTLCEKTKQPVVLLGDETWKRILNPLNLHPDSHGTHSMMVTDTVEVDQNVTQRIPLFLPSFGLSDDEQPKLSNLEDLQFSTLILHYLGLDHVGHLGGVRHGKLKPKLIELDKVIEDLYSSIPDRTLLLILGDHGMTDSGNHGGSSPDEVETAFVLIDPAFEHEIPNPKRARRTSQLDIAPTISSLLDLPLNPFGTGYVNIDLIPDSLWNSIPPLVQLKIFTKSALQLHQNPLKTDFLTEKITNIIERHLKILSTTKTTFEEEEKEEDNEEIHELKLSYISYLKERSSILQEASSASKMSTYLMIISMTISFGAILLMLRKSGYSLSKIELLSIANGVSLLSSTLIEEEHEFWYFVCQTLLILKTNTSSFIVVALVRLVRYWNVVGYLYSSSTEGSVRNLIGTLRIEFPLICLGCFLVFWKKKNFLNFSVMVVVIAMKFVSLNDANAIGNRSSLSNNSAAAAAADFSTDKVDLERGALVYLFVAQLIRFCLGGGPINKDDKTIFVFFFILLKQGYNCIPLVAIYYSTISLIESGFVEEMFCLYHLSFFILGNSHLVSSIDLTSSYLGVKEFNIYITSFLGFLSTWSGPLLVALVGFNCIGDGIDVIDVIDGIDGGINDDIDYRSTNNNNNNNNNNKNKKNKNKTKKFTTQLITGRSLIQLFLMISIFLQRNHLSLWTVWAPRLLFEGGWIAAYIASVAIALINHN